MKGDHPGKEDRLAVALRANLRRRKAQARDKASDAASVRTAPEIPDET